MSGAYSPIVGEDDYVLSQFQELMSDYNFYWPSEYAFYDEPLFGPLIDPPADTVSELLTPVSGSPGLGSPPDEFGLFVESDPVEELPLFLFNTPPADTISPTDLTPTTATTPRSPSTTTLSLRTPRSPDTIALSPGTPRSPGTDGSRASAAPTTPDSPGPENYEPVPVPTGGWKCAFPRCPRNYRRRCDVNKHCKTHTKPFACSSCGQKSSSKRDKERHELSHKSTHPKCPHPLCNSTTSRKDNMRDHIKRKHKDIDPKDPIIDELYAKRSRIR